MAKKSKVDVGKGFKRIFYVIAGLWIALMIGGIVGGHNACVVNKDFLSFRDCDNYSLISDIGDAIIWSAIVIPIYFFIKWIAAGFKKK